MKKSNLKVVFGFFPNSLKKTDLGKIMKNAFTKTKISSKNILLEKSFQRTYAIFQNSQNYKKIENIFKCVSHLYGYMREP